MRNPTPKQNRHQRRRLVSGLSNISTAVKMRQRQRLAWTVTTRYTKPLWQSLFLIQFTHWIPHFLSYSGCGVVGQDQQEGYPHPQAPGQGEVVLRAHDRNLHALHCALSWPIWKLNAKLSEDQSQGMTCPHSCSQGCCCVSLMRKISLSSPGIPNRSKIYLGKQKTLDVKME